MNTFSKLFVLVAFFFSALFIFSYQAHAAVIVFGGDYTCSNGTTNCYGTDCASTGYAWSDIPMSNCINQGNTPPANTCNASGNWDFTYWVCQVRADPGTGGCSMQTASHDFTCSAADACEGGSGGGTGYANNGHVIAGHCSIGSYVEGNPASACTSYGWYKQCCSSGGVSPTTACSAGSCPNGSITAPDVTTCGSPAPGAPTANGTYASCNGGSVSVNFYYTAGSSADWTEVRYAADVPPFPPASQTVQLPSSGSTINGFTPGHQINYDIYSCNSGGCTKTPNGYFAISKDIYINGVQTFPATCAGPTSTPTPIPTAGPTPTIGPVPTICAPNSVISTSCGTTPC